MRWTNLVARRPLVLGSVASLTFMLAARLGFPQEWGFALSVGSAALIWLVMVWWPRWVAP